MMADDVESLTASLVREYLSRKGLKNSLAVMDQEMPRDEHSVSNRAQLAKEIHIEKLMKKNKEHSIVYRTMLEVIVQFLREKGLSTSATNITKKGALAHVRTDGSHLSPVVVKSTREKRASVDRTKKADKPAETTEHLEDKQDYSDLLNRLEKSERIPKERETKEAVHVSSVLSLTDNVSHVKEIPSGSFTPSKTHRSRTRSAGLGGLIVSSGLGGTRGKRPGHTKSQTSELTITGHKFQTDKTSSEDAGVKENVESSNKDNMLWTEKEDKLRTLYTRKDVYIDSFNKISFSSDKIDKIKKEKALRPGSSASPRKTYQQKEELVFEDVDNDLDDSIGQLSLGSAQSITADFDSKPISLEQAMALKNLIFGSAKSSFNQEWRQQSFNFCDHYGLEYGIVQHKGGPCGVLAAVQAFVVKNLLFGEQRKADPRRCLQPSPRERTKALVSSITEILWQAGDFKSATVALPTGFGSSNFIGAGRYKPDKLTENLVLRTYTSFDSLLNYVNQQIKQFEDQSSSGCILLLYSTILSRTIKRVTSDMDDPNNKLMGAHGYCSQEMVNLIITGRATSNAFDNVIELDSGGSETVLLKGVEKQADVGLLSLFEHYGSCEIGMNYKNPKFPIWVVCSESHFSVLFSTNRTLLEEWDQKKRFDLFYYDGLSRQDEEIRLTVDTSQECPEHQDGDLIPPLEHVIRTRWKKAVIDWNGTEPIL